jgi:hypothetical protein
VGQREASEGRTMSATPSTIISFLANSRCVGHTRMMAAGVARQLHGSADAAVVVLLGTMATRKDVEDQIRIELEALIDAGEIAAMLKRVKFVSLDDSRTFARCLRGRAPAPLALDNVALMALCGQWNRDLEQLRKAHERIAELEAR